eukprot:1266794-Rhodomonas_salina.1
MVLRVGSLRGCGVLLRTGAFCTVRKQMQFATISIQFVSKTSVRACYAMPGTDLALCCYALSGTGLAYCAVCLRASYAMSGTDVAFGFVILRACYTLSGIGIGCSLCAVR